MQDNNIKDVLSQLLTDGSKHEEAKFFFPRVGDSSYKIVGGLNGKELIKYIAPPICLSILVATVPPINNVTFWIIKLFLFMIFFTCGVMLALLKPIPSRPNIRLADFLKNEIDFFTRQKTFYIKRKRNVYEEYYESAKKHHIDNSGHIDT